MKFIKFAEYLERIETTASRNDMTNILAEMLNELSGDEIDKAIYLALGRLTAQYISLEFNMSEKLMFRAVGQVIGAKTEDVVSGYKKVGDLGEYLFKESPIQDASLGHTLTEVYDRLVSIAKDEGSGSQDRKIAAMADLLSTVSPLERRYLCRIPLKKLRLGCSDMTVLDAISICATGDKSVRKEVERAYNVSADIGLIAKISRVSGVTALANVEVTPGIPIRPAAAERLPDAESIIEKFGEVAVEPKIDGFRLQCHYQRLGFISENSSVALYSRNLEDMTEMFPEISHALKDLPVDSIIIEGECVAFDPGSGEILPFQDTMQRRRKHDIASKAKKLPLTMFVFDLLYYDGQNFMQRPHKERRDALVELTGDQESSLRTIEEVVVSSSDDLREYFNRQIDMGREGIMAKNLDSPYTPGKRTKNWVKLKRDETSKLQDTIDCVVMGYKVGLGKRNDFGIGAFLAGVYDESGDRFLTVSNIGTGLTDAQWHEFKSRCERLKVEEKPSNYGVPDSLNQDVWVGPGIVVEIMADEITRSPLHTARMKGEELGYALRFPRLINWRDDKSPEQATTVKEIVQLFNLQKHINK